MAGLDTIGVLSVFDEEGRFSPVFDQDDQAIVEADTVILAIGQSVDAEALGGRRDLTTRHHRHRLRRPWPPRSPASTAAGMPPSAPAP